MYCYNLQARKLGLAYFQHAYLIACKDILLTRLRVCDPLISFRTISRAKPEQDDNETHVSFIKHLSIFLLVRGVRKRRKKFAS